jgi:hypothetical protein
MKQVKLRIVLFVIVQVLRGALKKHPRVRGHVGTRCRVVQIKLKDNSIGRWYEIGASGVNSGAGLHPSPDVTLLLKDLDTALTFLDPKVSQAEIIHAAKNFRVMVLRPDELCVWFMQLMNLTQTAGLEFGTGMADGSRRYTTNGNGGPMFVYVKDNKILRMTPIDLDANDAPSWTIRARGKNFTPKRRLPEHARRYPHEFSGGQRQRIAIARARHAPQADRARRAGRVARLGGPGPGAEPAQAPAN